MQMQRDAKEAKGKGVHAAYFSMFKVQSFYVVSGFYILWLTSFNDKLYNYASKFVN